MANVSVPQQPISIVKEFEDFFLLFEKEGKRIYEEKLRDLHSSGDTEFEFLFEDLLSHNPPLAEKLRNNPEEVLEEAILALKNTIKFKGSLASAPYYVRVATEDDHSPLFTPLRKIRSTHVGKFLYIRGIVTRMSALRDKILNASFECLLCGAEFDIIQLTDTVKKPRFCINKQCKAKSKSDFRLLKFHSEWIDWQSITIQEIPEELPAGAIPRNFPCILRGPLVDAMKPGERIHAFGYKSVRQTDRKNSTLFKPYMEINNVKSMEIDESIEITKEDLAEIKKLAAEEGIQKKIQSSIAPDIYGREDLKIASALSLFGGTRKQKPGGGYKRGDIHILFVGDPGTGKSQILKSAVSISPRGLYTSGKSSTAVGLTAAAIKDSDTGQWNLEAGAIVLANGGVAAIDEFDKMDTNDRSALHEAMEQQTISISKAGIMATLIAQTAIIAAANPHTGRYDNYKTPTQNIKLPPSLLSRFDLIFVVKDKPAPAHDAQLAEFILQNSMDPSELEEEVEEEEDSLTQKRVSPIPHTLLKKYIKYAKRNCFPSITKDSKERIKKFYLELRSEYNTEDAIVSILARNLDGIVRLSEAYAKMALREKVLKEDVDAIIKLFKRYLRDTGYDENTGKIDVDRVVSGESRSTLNRQEKVRAKIEELFEENEWKPLDKTSVIQVIEVDCEGLEKKFIQKVMGGLIKDGTLYEPKVGLIKFTSKREG